MTGSLITKDERNLLLENLFKSNSGKGVIKDYQWGKGTGDPNTADTDLTNSIGDKSKLDVNSVKTAVNEVELEGKLSSVTGNGETITEVGTFNRDMPSMLGLHAVFSGLSKSKDEELIFKSRNRMRNRR